MDCYALNIYKAR